MSRSDHPPDKLSAAINVLNQVRGSMLDQMADQVLDLADDLTEGGFQVNEFLELHGSRLHFLCLMISQFEMLREARLSEAQAEAKRSERRAKRQEKATAPHPAADDPSPPTGEETGTDK